MADEISHAELYAEIKSFRQLFDALSKDRDKVITRQADAIQTLAGAVHALEKDFAILAERLASRDRDIAKLQKENDGFSSRLRNLEIRAAGYAGAAAVLVIVIRHVFGV